MAPVHIRWLIRRDMVEVLAIEQQGFGPHAWTQEDFLRVLRERNCIGMVAERGEAVVGFMVYELQKNFLRVLNMAVHADWRHQAVATQMVQKLISKLASHRRERIVLEARETNLDAQLFFSKQGFRALRVLRDYFVDSGEDAYLMQYKLGSTELDEEAQSVNRIAQYDAADAEES